MCIRDRFQWIWSSFGWLTKAKLEIVHFRVKINAQAGFDYLLQGEPEGDFLHAPPSFSLGSQLSNKTSCKLIGAQLVSQPAPKPKLLSTGLNPAHWRCGFWLDDLLSSNFCETLGHEKKSKYLSRHGPKVGEKDRLMLPLSSSSKRVNPCLLYTSPSPRD